MIDELMNCLNTLDELAVRVVNKKFMLVKAQNWQISLKSDLTVKADGKREELKTAPVREAWVKKKLLENDLTHDRVKLEYELAILNSEFDCLVLRIKTLRDILKFQAEVMKVKGGEK